MLRRPTVLVLDVFLYDRYDHQVGERGVASMGETGPRDVGRLVVPAIGAVVEAAGDRVLPVRLAGADGAEVAVVTEFLPDQRACGGSASNARSYTLALLRWFRFLHAVGVGWDRAGREVTHLGMPDFRPAVGRSSGTGGGP